MVHHRAELHVFCVGVVSCFLARRAQNREIVLDNECLRSSRSALLFSSWNIASKSVPEGGRNSPFLSVAFLVPRSNMSSSMFSKCLSSCLSNSTSIFWGCFFLRYLPKSLIFIALPLDLRAPLFRSLILDECRVFPDEIIDFEEVFAGQPSLPVQETKKFTTWQSPSPSTLL